MTRIAIGVFGGYHFGVEAAEFGVARELGARLAEAGFDLVNGGYDGVMGASAEGAHGAGGHVIGVTCPTVLRKRGQDLQPNRFNDEIHESPTLLDRIDHMMRRCGGYVFLPGGTGTLSELGVIWEYVHKGFISPRPLVLLGPYWQPLLEVLRAGRPGSTDCIHPTAGPAEAVAVLQREARSPADDPAG